MRKISNFTITLLLIIVSSCNSTDCGNGIQDGNETGIDCGGDCTACTTTTPIPSCNISPTAAFFNINLIGKWKPIYMYDLESQSELETPDEYMEFNCAILNTSPSGVVRYKSLGKPQYPWGETYWSYYHNVYDIAHETNIDSILAISEQYYRIVELNQNSLKLDYLEPQQDQSIMSGSVKWNIHLIRVQ